MLGPGAVRNWITLCPCNMVARQIPGRLFETRCMRRRCRRTRASLAAYRPRPVTVSSTCVSASDAAKSSGSENVRAALDGIWTPARRFRRNVLEGQLANACADKLSCVEFLFLSLHEPYALQPRMRLCPDLRRAARWQ